MAFKTVVIVSDFHCGHVVGLTPPQYQSASGSLAKFGEMQKAVWKFYSELMKKLQPIHLLIVNGDAIEGKGERSGGTELIEADRTEQVQMSIQCIEKAKAKNIIMTFGCLTAGHRILTADLRWIPVERLNAGDKLLAFDENGSGNGHRKFIESEVIINKPFISDVYDLFLSDGSKITATGDHPFLMSRGGRPPAWTTVNHLYKISRTSTPGFGKKDGHSKYMPIPFPRTLPIWDDDRSYEAGYLSGFFDGEGTLNQSNKNRRRFDNKSQREFISLENCFALSAVQKDNACLKFASECLKKLNFQIAHASHDKRSDCYQITVLGGFKEKLRLLGSVRPRRLLENFDISKLCTIGNKKQDNLMLIDICPAGKQTVYGLSTSSKTYISEGFLSHNTPYHTGVTEDFERSVADAVNAKIGSHEWIDINGLIFDCKHKIGSSVIPHGRHTAIARDRLWNQLWSIDEQQPLADIIIRSHVHYFNYSGDADVLAMTTPAIQGYGSKYGARQCSGRVDIGLVWFKIDDKGAYEWKPEIMRTELQKTRALKL